MCNKDFFIENNKEYTTRKEKQRVEKESNIVEFIIEITLTECLESTKIFNNTKIINSICLQINGTSLLNYNYYEKGELDSVTNKNDIRKLLVRFDEDVAIDLLYCFLYEKIYFAEHFIITDIHDGKYMKTISYSDIDLKYGTDKGKQNSLKSEIEYYYSNPTEHILKTEHIIGNYYIADKEGKGNIRIVDITDNYMDIEVAGLFLPCHSYTFQTNGITRIYLINNNSYYLGGSLYIGIYFNSICLKGSINSCYYLLEQQ